MSYNWSEDFPVLVNKNHFPRLQAGFPRAFSCPYKYLWPACAGKTNSVSGGVVKLSSSRQAPNPLAALLSRPRPVVRIGRVIEMAVLWALVFVCLMVISKVAGAQERQPLSLITEAKNTRYVQQHAIDVPDSPGHQVRVLEVQRTYPDAPKIDGVAILSASFWGASDYIEGKGTAKGYAVWNLADGNKVFGRWEGVAYSDPVPGGARQGEFRGMTWITGGTGTFNSVRGVLHDTVRFNTDPKNGYSAGETKGEYWFEK